MANSQIPTPETLRQLLRYEPETGLLFWRERSADMFRDAPRQTAKAACKGFNTRYGNREAFTSIGSHGYKEGAVNGHGLLAHRVIWAIHAGEWPVDEIDHVNGIRVDNRWVNLRSVDRSQNCKNVSIRSDNSSGVVGVDYYGSRGLWRARITSGGVAKTIGYFGSKSCAVEARRAAEVKYGFHKNHGRKTI